MKYKIREKINDFIKVNKHEGNVEILNSLIGNRQNTQSKVIYYRKTFLIATCIYYMIILNIFDPSIIGIKFNEASNTTRLFGFNSLMEFIILMAPITFSSLYYVMVLSLIHRSVLNIAINKIQEKNFKKESILHYLSFPFSSGLIIKLLSLVGSNRLISTLRINIKHIEYILYIIVVVCTIIVLIKNIVPITNLNPIIAIISTVSTIIILTNTWGTLYNYKKTKNASN